MKENFKNLKSYVEDAEIVLVGIGEEFDGINILAKDEKYQRICKHLASFELEALLPYVNSLFLKKNQFYMNAIANLEKLLEGKNYFIVSTCMDGLLLESNLNSDKIVTPCGNISKLQCKNGCQEALFDTPNEFYDLLAECIEKETGWEELKDHKCGVCGEEMVFNTLYAKHYLEGGYLPKWSTYTTWLQGTVNKRLCVLEFGVGLKYPSVIRWPFEKTAYYNKKAFFVRVHEKLSQLTPDLSEKGIGIAVNSVEFLADI